MAEAEDEAKAVALVGGAVGDCSGGRKSDRKKMLPCSECQWGVNLVVGLVIRNESINSCWRSPKQLFGPLAVQTANNCSCSSI